MPDEKKKWALKKDEVHPADLPEEVYESQIESDDAKMMRDAVAARLIGTPTPPENEWKACWTCGKRVPLRVRDSVMGVLVCRQCAWTSFLQEFLANTESLVSGIGDFLGGAAGIDHDVDDDPEPEDDVEVDGEGADAPTEAMPISPSAVEADGGGEAKAEPKGEAAPDDQEPEKKD